MSGIETVITEVRQKLEDVYHRLDAEGHNLASDVFSLIQKIKADVENVVVADTQDVVESNAEPDDTTPPDQPVTETPTNAPVTDTTSESESGS